MYKLINREIGREKQSIPLPGNERNNRLFYLGNILIVTPPKLNGNSGTIKIESKILKLNICPHFSFEDSEMSLYYKNNTKPSLFFDSYQYIPEPKSTKPTLEQLSVFYDELIKLLQENNIEL